MDILLDSTGDLFVSPKGDISICNSIAQKIRIKLLWFAKEWRWDVDEGMPYKDSLLIKNPDTNYFEGVIRRKIFEIAEITEVKEVSVVFDSRTRSAVIRFVALTDLETIKEELTIESMSAVKINRIITNYNDEGYVVVSTNSDAKFETEYNESGDVNVHAKGDVGIKSINYKGGKIYLNLVKR